MGRKLGTYRNEEGTYCIVNEKGEIIEEFRGKGAAKLRLVHWKKIRFDEELRIVKE